MSLITRCPACATMFKVVADQLKVAQGWVRCGHCGEVFDAYLQFVTDEAARPGGLASTPGAMPAQSPAASPENLTDPPGEALTLVPVDSPQDIPAQQGEADAAVAEPMQQAPQQEVAEVEEILGNASPDPQGRQERVFTADAGGVEPRGPADTVAVDFPATAPEGAASAAEAPEAVPEVSFVREARRKDFWKTPLVRALLGLIFAVLLAALSLQWMVRKKDVLAAQEPRLAPLLQALCRPLDCQIRPLRRIESLVIDSSNFSKTGPDAYRLTFVFKNTGAAVLEIPALEVTLTDSRDQALVRRVVMPAQFGVTAVTLGAYSELAGAISISLKASSDDAQEASSSIRAGSLPVAGYRILAFYP
jgi:predicted Zn finger-like uncharacterized protein